MHHQQQQHVGLALPSSSSTTHNGHQHQPLGKTKKKRFLNRDHRRRRTVIAMAMRSSLSAPSLGSEYSTKDFMKEQQLSVNAMSGAELLALNENEVSENAELNNVAAVERRTRAAEDVRRTKMKNEIKLVRERLKRAEKMETERRREVDENEVTLQKEETKKRAEEDARRIRADKVLEGVLQEERNACETSKKRSARRKRRC